ncbi:hypothetical protein ASG51_14845 [Methylobacterium sp. Leaf465]|nr:hypothetical protein ASG51_14845 [Methylobacterium sp. Leaf465]
MTDDRGVHDAVSRQDEGRLRGRGSEWAGPVNRAHELGGDTACAHCAIHLKRFDSACFGNGLGQNSREVIAKTRNVRTRQRDARRHSVAATLQGNPCLDRRADRVP